MLRSAFLKQSITPLPSQGFLKASRVAFFWLSLSLLFAAYYGMLGLNNAFRDGLIVQDDARLYVFWMQRWLDPSLFSHDLIADYFQSITPSGYAALYHAMASIGIPPLLFSKLLPFGLGIITTFYCFWVCLEIFPIPLAGFIATLLLNQSCWFKDDLASAAPRGFSYPLLLAFLYYLLRGSWRGVCLVNVLQGFFYPPLIFFSTVLLGWRSLVWNRRIPRWQADPKQTGYALLAAGLGLLSLLPYAIHSSQFGPVVTGAEARLMPEFWQGGRHPFFNANLWWFWLVGQHSGILPTFLPPFIWLGLGLPILLRHRIRFPLAQQIQPSIAALSQTVWVSLSLFIAAHALLLKLFFPTRYTQHSLRIVMALAAGIVITILLDSALRSLEQLDLPVGDQNCESTAPLNEKNTRQRLATKRSAIWGSIVLFSLALVITPAFFEHFPKTNYRIVKDGSLYEFLQQQPPDALTATLTETGNYIPTFAHRPVLVAGEYALPFHRKYYDTIRERSLALIQAQFSPDITQAQSLIRKYGVRFWLLNRDSLKSDYLAANSRSWLRSFQPAYDEAIASLKQKKPALASLMGRCSVFRQGDEIVLSADCILRVPVK